MLKKLMKHELRATSNIMLPLLGIVLLLSAGMSILLRIDFGHNIVLSIFTGIISVAYAVALGAVFVVVLVLMINRFRTNLLGDEGYVMFTLPVSVHQLLWSKILISCLWFTASIFAVCVSALILAADGNFFQAILYNLGDFFAYLDAYYAMHGLLYIIEALLIFFVSYAAACLQIYAAMAFGYSFDRHKVLFSLGGFFAVQFILQFIGTLFLVSSVFDNLLSPLFVGLSGISGLHTGLCLVLLLVLIYGAAFYFITTHFLQKKLNIE